LQKRHPAATRGTKGEPCRGRQKVWVKEKGEKKKPGAKAPSSGRRKARGSNQGGTLRWSERGGKLETLKKHSPEADRYAVASHEKKKKGGGEKCLSTNEADTVPRKGGESGGRVSRLGTQGVTTNQKRAKDQKRVRLLT